jgi:methyl-accepting chemotaxis protein
MQLPAHRQPEGAAMHSHPRLVAGMTRQTSLSALDAMIEAGRAGAPSLAGLAADMAALAARTAQATEAMRSSVAGTGEIDDVAATLTAMRDAALDITEALRRQAGTAASQGGNPDSVQPMAGNSSNG